MAKILVFEPYFGGHHTNYIEAVVSQIGGAQKLPHIDEIVICTNDRHKFTNEFEALLASPATPVSLDLSLPHFHHIPDFHVKRAISRAMLAAVSRYAPDVVISTTGDHEVIIGAMAGFFGIRLVPRRTRTIAMVHGGYAGIAQTPKSKVKDFIYDFAYRFGQRDRLFAVNPIEYAHLKQKGIAAELMPDPIPHLPGPSKTEARRALGLPVDGRYVGHVGSTDGRKAIPELLRGFKAARTPGDRLLFAGRMDAQHREVMARECSELVAQGHIIHLDRFLSVDDIANSIRACDVLAPIAYPRSELSANFLNAVSLERPVIVDDFGYTGAISRTFDVGIACKGSDVSDVARAIATALDTYLDYRPDAAVQKLIAFHWIENFGATLRKAIYEEIGVAHHESPLSWEEVTAGAWDQGVP